MKVLHQIVAVIALFIVCGCSASVDDLVGTFGVFENGRVNEYFRIEKRDAKYYLFEKANGQWGVPLEMKTMSHEDITKALQSSENASQLIGLMDLAGNAAILKCRPGTRFGTFTSETGYWAGTMLGPIDLHKMTPETQPSFHNSGNLPQPEILVGTWLNSEKSVLLTAWPEDPNGRRYITVASLDISNPNAFGTLPGEYTVVERSGGKSAEFLMQSSYGAREALAKITVSGKKLELVLTNPRRSGFAKLEFDKATDTPYNIAQWSQQRH